MYKVDSFGKLSSGQSINLHTIYNDSIQVSISEYGACITSLKVRDRSKKFIDVVGGFNDVKFYEKKCGSMGFTIGRYANRIADAKFSLNGTEYILAKNNGENSLHGGNVACLSKKVFNLKYISNDNKDIIQAHVISPDGEEGYPGNLDLKVNFIIDKNASLTIEYEATCDKDTIINLTNHSYFNLNGHNHGSILEHSLHINSDMITEIKSDLIPTGNFYDITNTPFDFAKDKKIKDALKYVDSNEFLNYAGGLDHNYVIKKSNNNFVARLTGDESGIVMNTYSDQPGAQFYTACSTDIPNGKENAHYKKYSLICIETQHYPDSIHHENFPSVVLKKDDIFKTYTTYEFLN